LKTGIITFFFGIGRVGNSIRVGFIGITLGLPVNKLVEIKSTRIYCCMDAYCLGIWLPHLGYPQIDKAQRVLPFSFHPNGSNHIHSHKQIDELAHLHDNKSYKELTP